MTTPPAQQLRLDVLSVLQSRATARGFLARQMTLKNDEWRMTLDKTNTEGFVPARHLPALWCLYPPACNFWVVPKMGEIHPTYPDTVYVSRNQVMGHRQMAASYGAIPLWAIGPSGLDEWRRNGEIVIATADVISSSRSVSGLYGNGGGYSVHRDNCIAFDAVFGPSRLKEIQ